MKNSNQNTVVRTQAQQPKRIIRVVYKPKPIGSGGVSRDGTQRQAPGFSNVMDAGRKLPHMLDPETPVPQKRRMPPYLQHVPNAVEGVDLSAVAVTSLSRMSSGSRRKS